MKISPELERQILARPDVVVTHKPAVPQERALPSRLRPAMVRLNEEGVFFAVLPLATTAEVNGRDWRARSKRTDAAWRAVSRTLGPRLDALSPFALAYHAGRSLGVTFTRLGGRKVDRSNLPTATKAVEDALAYLLGADDGDPRWRAEWHQEPGGLVGVGIRIEVIDGGTR